MSTAKQRNRSVSENFSPSNYQLFPSSGGGPSATSLPLLSPSFGRSGSIEEVERDGSSNNMVVFMNSERRLTAAVASANAHGGDDNDGEDEAIRKTAFASLATPTTAPLDTNETVNGVRRHSLQARTMSKTKSILNAVTFVSELQVSSAKQAKHNREQPLTRRFSVNSIAMDINIGRRTSDLARWSKNLIFTPFRSKVGPAARTSADHSAQLLRDVDRIHPLTIRHDSPHRSVWDVFVLVMICVDMVFTPLSLGFDYYPTYASTLNLLGIVVFFVDFVANAFSSYQNERSEVVSGPYNTTRHYLLSIWALPDLLSWFPFEFLALTDKGRFLSFAKVIRLAKVSQLARKLHSAKKAGFVRFMRLLGTVFLVSHCLTCFWNWAAVDWKRNEPEMADRSLGERYAHCWSLVIGCLNASPPSMFSTVEELSVAIFMLIGNVLQASVFGSVAAVITSFDESEVAYNKKLISTYERCKFLGIPEPLSQRIQGFYENLYRETKSVSPDADSFINELSPAMICEVKFQLYRDMIKQIPFLSAQKIDPTVIELLILHLRTVIYMQDDVLIRKGEFGDWMGFIGSKGLVGVLDPHSLTRKIIRVLRKGEYFGEMALLQRSKRSTTAVALTWVQIHVLCRVDLDDVKEQYPGQAQILEDEINKYMQTKVAYK